MQLAILLGAAAAAPIQPAATAPQSAAAGLGSVFDMVLGGGPMMVPIALCSIVALAYAVERWLRLRSSRLGTNGFGTELVAAVREGGAERGVELCAQQAYPLARVMQPALLGWRAPYLEREKTVEDAGHREVRRLSANLKPLVVVAMIAPLLGLLGTVWGMILAFGTIAAQDGLGKPAMLADGISQALITTAAGLSIAIPTQAVYYYLKGRVERFARQAEELYAQLCEVLAGGGAAR
ncbi:MAG TPA: MotA/TolQ/ExbB proton channel family protein [Myxococcota bacterium]|nr:MotA/TolQ/ExbB proton channel family protein [Myxococcota bacterium]